jgi:hypothetical protein
MLTHPESPLSDFLFTNFSKDKKKSVPVFPALYHGIFMLKSNVDTSIELDTIKCANILTLPVHHDWIQVFMESVLFIYMFFEFLCGPANCLSVYDIERNQIKPD